MADDQKEKDTTEPGCNCDDAFRLEDCPVHPSEKEKAVEYALDGVKEVVVTPAHRAEPTRKTGWVGFSFSCENCEKPSILEWFNFCPNCGSKIIFTFEVPKE